MIYCVCVLCPVYVWVLLCVCVFFRMYVCVWLCVLLCVCVFLLCVCMGFIVCICVYSMYVCVLGCVCMWFFVCMCVWLFVSLCVGINNINSHVMNSYVCVCLIMRNWGKFWNLWSMTKKRSFIRNFCSCVSCVLLSSSIKRFWLVWVLLCVMCMCVFCRVYVCLFMCVLPYVRALSFACVCFIRVCLVLSAY